MKLDPARQQYVSLVRRLSRILVIFITLVFCVGFLIVPLELRAEHRHIHSAFDGVWWAMGAITMVGYGDVVPVTQEGRILSMFLQMSGVLLLGSIAGVMVTHFYYVENEYRWKRLHEKLERMEDKQKTLNNKLDYLVKNRDSTLKKTRQLGL